MRGHLMPTFLFSHTLHALPHVAIGLAFALVASGCKEDKKVTTLFDEARGGGVWKLEDSKLPNIRDDAFMLKFFGEPKVVQTASCGEEITDGPSNSQCDLLQNPKWFCQCFAYDFVENNMLWVPMEPGATPPEVMLDEPRGAVVAATGGDATDGDDPTGDSDGQSTAGEGISTQGTLITLSETDIVDTYGFSPLPEGVFGSDGASSFFVFRQVTPTLFDRVFDSSKFETCEPCAPLDEAL